MKKRKNRISLLVIFSLLGIFHSLHAETVRVSVLDEEKNVIAGATVNIWFAGGGYTVTD